MQSERDPFMSEERSLAAENAAWSKSPPESVSVIIPVYNAAKFIAQTLRSILHQTIPPTEIIVINDGSPDDSAAVVATFGDAVRLINRQNSGAAASRNFGATQARSKWLAFCDADDLWIPTKLEKQLTLAKQVPEVHFVITDYTASCEGKLSPRSHFSYAPPGFWGDTKDYPEGFVVCAPLTGKLTVFQPSITSTAMVKRDFYLDSGGFDPDVEFGAEDTCFHFRCLSVVPFAVVPEVLMHYTRHPASISADPLVQLRRTVAVWEHIIDTYPDAQPWRTELLQGPVEMRKEIAATARYERRQKIKRWLGLGRPSKG